MLDLEIVSPEEIKKVFRRVRTSASAHGARTAARIKHDLTFVGVDGEGQRMPDGSHRYVLLSVGTNSLAAEQSWNGPKLDTVQYADVPYLTYREIFPFLWRHYQADPDAAYIGFYLGYDFCHWIRDLKRDRAAKLLTAEGIKSRTPPHSKRPDPYPVWVPGWDIDILPGNKRFRLRAHAHTATKNDPTICQCGERADFFWPATNSGDWMHICDSGPFWQTSFLKAIDPREWPVPVVSKSEYLTILEGKSVRGAAKLDADMVRYNLLENDVLTRITRVINLGFVQNKIKLSKKQFFGPGQVAQAWLDNIGVPRAKVLVDHLPLFATEAGRMSYFGGWFETFMHGLIPGTSYEYDINSAYPSIIANLPCLLHGKWTTGTENMPLETPTIRFVKARVNGKKGAKIGAMLHRTMNGHVCRPLQTMGWYVWDELVSAQRAKLVTKVQIFEWVDYNGCDCEPPIAAIRELYEQRLIAGKKSPVGKALKLTYNSPYGKFAQSVGSPKFSNSIYASLITARCRAMICDAIASHPTGIRDVIMVATDGVYFRTPHTNLPLSDTQLGLWSEGTKENLSVFLPGLYWDDETRKGGLIHSRGVGANDLRSAIDSIDRQWASGLIPTYELPIRFAMTSPNQAIQKGWNWESCGAVFACSDECHDDFHGQHCTARRRKLNANPRTKRRNVHKQDDVLVSDPYTMNGNGFWNMGMDESEPYSKLFGDFRVRNLDNPDATDHYIAYEGGVIDGIRLAIQDLTLSDSANLSDQQILAIAEGSA